MKNRILVSRLHCGCVASALLDCSEGQKDIKEFTDAETKLGRVVTWEIRDTISAERCQLHDKKQEDSHD